MTSDELISMHTACCVVIDDLSKSDGMPEHVQLHVIKKSVRTLAVVQRDILKMMLGE